MHSDKRNTGKKKQKPEVNGGKMRTKNTIPRQNILQMLKRQSEEKISGLNKYKAKKRAAKINWYVENEPSTSGEINPRSVQYNDITSTETRLIDRKNRNNSSEKKLPKKTDYLNAARTTLEKGNQKLKK